MLNKQKIRVKIGGKPILMLRFTNNIDLIINNEKKMEKEMQGGC